jgi:putative membrane protein
MTDLLLTSAHHLLVFSLIGVFAAEVALVRGTMSAQNIRIAAILDAHAGLFAVLTLVVGFLRVYYGAKGAAFFMQNPVFWMKIGAFTVVALLSIIPTVRILQWRRKSKADASFVPPASEVSQVRKVFMAMIVAIAALILFAGAMVRGIGY